jgi:hypothetical protein
VTHGAPVRRVRMRVAICDPVPTILARPGVPGERVSMI